MKLEILVLLFFMNHVVSGREPKLVDFEKVRIDKDPKTMENVRNLHVNWFAHSIKALMMQLGKDLYSKLPTDQKHSLANCLDKIEDKKDLVSSAKCLVAARKRFQVYELKRFSHQSSLKQLSTLKKPSFVQFGSKKVRVFDLHSYPTKRITFVPRYPMKPQKTKEKFKELLNTISHDFQRSSRFSKFAAKIKFDQSRHHGFNKRAKRFAFDNLIKSQLEANSRSDKNFNKWKAIGKTPIGKVTNLINQFVVQRDNEEKINLEKWGTTYKRLLNLKEEMAKRESKPGSRVYDFRMYDLVLDNEKPTLGPKDRRSPGGLVDMAMRFIDKMSGSGKNKEGNTKILSPRFAPLMPDKSSARKEILSPTLFAFYEENMDNKSIASIPSMLKSTGMKQRDRESIMDLIMTVTGTTKTVENALNLLNSLNFVGIEKPVMKATEKISTAFEALDSSLTETQRTEMDRKGFAFMNKFQMEKLYKDEGINMPEEALDLDYYDKLKPEDRENALWARIERIAINLPDDHPRLKRQITWISVLNPVILAPYMFSPVFGASILGPVILSPNIFSPLILNPAVLGPFILSPAVAMPFILSPYVLSPYILTPIVMAPFILNPYVLSPNILNPYVLSPLILSPLVLCPDILSPQVLGGAILSPSVLSPAVLTESALMANVLSPTFLS
ncbi:hypothetical protein FO519_005085 [Halicephalobus sp. NKZ332]|nr:hypothetical protein FO519_005085 [Halicephalobus sp. NKZ332]